VQFLARITVAIVSGAIIAWVVMELVLYAQFAAGGYTREARVELPGWAVGAIGGLGGLLGLTTALVTDRFSFPGWARLLALGGLIGVAFVVVPTLGIACTFGGPSSKGQAPYLIAGLVYGIPVGLVVGAVVGLLGARKQ
jgi:hypothetical protein